MPSILQDINTNKQDAIIWQVSSWQQAAGDDIFEQGKVKMQLVDLLCLIPSDAVRQSYVAMLSTQFKKLYTKKNLEADLKERQKKYAASGGTGDEGEDPYATLPSFMNRDELEAMGFCAAQGDHKICGYWGWDKYGKIRLTNFIITPVFHVYQKEESRHIFKITNHNRTRVMDLPSKVFVSVDTLSSALVGEGNFLIWASNNQLRNISSNLLDHFPICLEIKQLGWQPEGFFAYVNKVIVPGKAEAEIDEWGVAEVEGKKYLIPAASVVYADLRSTDDPFQNERALTWYQSPVGFKEWAIKMGFVYKEHGLVGVAAVLMACFRDIVFDIDNNCPLIYAYGEKSAGKSKWAESLGAFFFKGRAAFQLNSGTDFAFFNYVSMFRNTISLLNEFDDKVTKPEWFQAIKGFYDGESRQRGKMSTSINSRRSTETQKADSVPAIIGQYLSTADDNSVVTRSIICPFHERQFTEQEREAYNTLKGWESAGITSLSAEVLKHRPLVKEQYYKTFSENLAAWRRQVTDQFNQRIFQNWCHLATLWQILHKPLSLPAQVEAFNEYCYDQAVNYSSFIRRSDILAEFWNTVAVLFDEQQLVAGWDFDIVVRSEVKVRRSNGEEEKIEFHTNEKLLFIRLNIVHKKYQVRYRQTTGKEGMTYENLKHYISNRNYYVGEVKTHRFKRYEYVTTEQSRQGSMLDAAPPKPIIATEKAPTYSNTSANVFKYDLLSCELEHFNPAVDGDGAGGQSPAT